MMIMKKFLFQIWLGTFSKYQPDKKEKGTYANIIRCFKVIYFSRFKAIMSPLGLQTSKKSDKLIVGIIWIVAFCLALPMAFFYEFTYVRDKTSGVKPFCVPYKLSSVSREYDTRSNQVNTTGMSIKVQKSQSIRKPE